MLDPFANKLLLLFGDLAQLPLVCKHAIQICQNYLTITSTYFKHVQFHLMKSLVQHVTGVPMLEISKTIS